MRNYLPFQNTCLYSFWLRIFQIEVSTFYALDVTCYRLFLYRKPPRCVLYRVFLVFRLCENILTFPQFHTVNTSTLTRSPSSTEFGEQDCEIGWRVSIYNMFQNACLKWRVSHRYTVEVIDYFIVREMVCQ